MLLIAKAVLRTAPAALILMGSMALHAQSANNANPDEQFVRNASSGGTVEVKLGELAQKKGSNEAVKAFGKRMVDDHSQAGDKLKAAASESNIKVSDKMTPKDEATYSRLEKLSGPSFDREYSKEMVSDHTHDIAEFRKEANGGKDSSIKMFAAETLPTLEDHLKQAREMEKTVSGTASNKLNTAK